MAKLRATIPLLIIMAAGLLAVAVIYRAARPSADVSGRTILVGTDTELTQAITSAIPGTTILLKPGIYRPFTIINKERVTIQAQKLKEYEASRQPFEIGDLSLLPHIQGSEKTKDVIYARGYNLAFRGLHVSVAQRNGILIDNTTIVLVESSVIHDVARTNGQGILFDSTRNATAKNNVIYDIQGERAHAIYAAGSASDGATFIGNRGYDIAGAVYQLNAEDRRGDKTISGAVIANNIAHDGPFGGNFCGVTDSRFINNLGFRLDKGWTFYAGNGLCVMPQQNKLYHNTIVTRDGETIAIQDGKNFDIRNNILTGGKTSGIDAKANLIGQSADLFVTTDGKGYLDYRPHASLSVLNKGAVLAGVTTDLLGLQRTLGGGPDYGAFEYGPTETVSSPAPSPIITAIPISSTVQLASERGLSISWGSEGVQLNWQAYTKSNLKNYIVSRFDEGASVFRRVATLSPDQLSYVDTTAKLGEAYRYKIRIITEKRKLFGSSSQQIADWIEPITVQLPIE